MPSFLTNQTEGAGVAGDVQLAANFNKFFISQSDAGRELVVSATKANMTDAELLTVTQRLGQLPDVGTVAAIGTADGEDFVSGTTGVVFFRLQTTGTPILTDVGSVVLAIVAEFKPRA